MIRPNESFSFTNNIVYGSGNSSRKGEVKMIAGGDSVKKDKGKSNGSAEDNDG